MTSKFRGKKTHEKILQNAIEVRQKAYISENFYTISLPGTYGLNWKGEKKLTKNIFNSYFC